MYYSESLLLDSEEMFTLMEPQQRAFVQFGEPLTREMPARSSLSDEEKEAMFYAREELRAMRDEASTMAKQVIRKQNLEKPMSYAAVVKRTYDACCLGNAVPKSDDIRLLVRWGKLRPARRGLEKVCVPDVCQRSRDRRMKAVRTVLEIQKRAQHLKPSEREQLLRKASVTVGQVARVHARVLGIVDAASVTDMLETETTVAEKRALDEAFGSKLEDCQPMKRMRTVSVGVATA